MRLLLSRSVCKFSFKCAVVRVSAMGVSTLFILAKHGLHVLVPLCINNDVLPDTVIFGILVKFWVPSFYYSLENFISIDT